jgi:sn-glycerol 3-phosphate transport system ATP-binding protein
MGTVPILGENGDCPYLFGPVSSIQLEGVAKHWGSARALDSITFDAEPGSFVVLLGPSGCGKSTTLRIIAGLDTPSEGRVLLAGRDVTALPPARRGIAMVFQSYALFPHLTVAENIVFGLKVRKVAAGERDKRLKRVAGLLGLGALLERKPSQLSGGQQQRVALGRAIIAESPVCLMDEPLSNLDAQLRGEMRREIRSLQQRLGITMVYVTHDQTEAMTMADRVVLMRGGRIEQVGTPEELYAKPATAFTASFIGAPAMNLMTVGGRDVTVGVRPENMTLSPALSHAVTLTGARGRGGFSLEAKVESVEYLGADSLISVTADTQPLLVRVPGKASIKTGDAVRVAWEKEHEHHFDTKTGQRVTH